MDSSLLEALSTRTPANVLTPCGYTRLLATMPADEQEAVKEAFSKVLADTRSGRAKVYSYAWLSGVLNDHKYSISSSTLARHARGKCGCE